jgi:pimeloyl-ACP methyl ester carboxylesterase
VEALAPDHRVTRYDVRGTGRSTRTGPHDMETSAGDLEAVLEATGGPAVLVGIADAASFAAPVAARRPDLVAAVIAIAGAPVSREMFLGTDSMVGSDAVIDAFLDMIETDYRGAIRSLVTAANPQMSEDELRERTHRQVEYCPHEAAVGRVRAWVAADATDAGLALGERLWLLYADDVAGPWFPKPQEYVRRVSEALPRAHLRHLEEGIVSRPDLTAELLRTVAAPLRAGT